MVNFNQPESSILPPSEADGGNRLMVALSKASKPFLRVKKKRKNETKIKSIFSKNHYF